MHERDRRDLTKPAFIYIEWCQATRATAVRGVGGSRIMKVVLCVSLWIEQAIRIDLLF